MPPSESASRRLAEEKLRQRIRESDPDIRRLESKLRNAYIDKERAAQLAEKKLAKELEAEEKEEEALRDKKMREERDREERLREEEEVANKIKYRSQLTTQLEGKQLERNQAYAEFLREKHR